MGVSLPSFAMALEKSDVASFNRDHCFLGPGWWCFVSDYRAQYEEHCKDMGIKESDILSAKALTMRLTTEYDVIAGLYPAVAYSSTDDSLP
jgi:hypothetical protein